MTDQASKVKGLAWVVGALMLGAVCAVGLSPLIHAIPWKWEQGLATLLPAPSNDICSGDMQTNALLTQLVGRLYPVEQDDGRISITVRIVDDSAINAYAALGGNIYVNEGLLKNADSAEEVPDFDTCFSKSVTLQSDGVWIHFCATTGQRFFWWGGVLVGV